MFHSNSRTCGVAAAIFIRGFALVADRTRRPSKCEVVALAAERELCGYSAVNRNYRDGQG
jgi:hypothetical protein